MSERITDIGMIALYTFGVVAMASIGFASGIYLIVLGVQSHP